jgi:hypothetical protein
MKTIISIAVLFISLPVFSQPPLKMNYQLVIRNSSNALVTNQQVGIKVSILQGSSTGVVAYAETYTPTTNANGLATFIIGDGTVVTANLANINWGNGPFFIKTEVDPTGGTNYTISATSQLLSVPYALYAGNLAYRGKTHLVLSGELTDAQAAAKIAAEAGPDTRFVWIENCRNLTTLNLPGLTNLVEVLIYNNKRLNTVSFPDLASIDMNMDIATNDSLANISFPTLATMGGSLGFTSNARLSSLNFPLLSSISVSLQYQLNNIASISFPSLQTISDDLYINNNTGLSGISFPILTQVGDNLTLSNNATLSSASFPALTTVHGKLYIDNEASLSSLSVTSLSTIKDIDIQDAGLTSLNFPALTTVTGTLSLNNLASLSSVSLAGLSVADYITIQTTGITSFSTPALTSVGHNIRFFNNALLVALSFPALINIGYQLYINNPLSSLSVPVLNSVVDVDITSATLTALSFPACTYSSRFYIHSCSALASFSVPLITTLSNGLILTGITSLTTLSLPQLGSVSALLNIGGSAQLTSISLPALTSVPGAVLIQTNTALTSVSFPLLNYLGASNTTASTFDVSSNKLPGSQVNALLSLLVNMTPQLTAKTIKLSQSPSAPPTAQGLTDKATLISRGNTVTTN